jgi:translation initiation factor IF-2
MPMKVHELAEEYKIDPKALLNHLRDLGVFVSSHMSLLDEEEVAKVRATIGHVQKRQEVTEQRVKSTVIRRRTVKAAPQVAPAPPEETPPEPIPDEAAAAPPPTPAEEVPTPAEALAQEEGEPPPAEAGKPRRRKKEKAKEAAIVIRRPEISPKEEPKAEAAAVVETPAPPPSGPQPEEAPQVPQEAGLAQDKAEAGRLADGLEPLQEVAQEAAAQEPPAKPTPARKGRLEGGYMEPAKILERPRPEMVRRLVKSVPAPAPPAVPAPKIGPPADREAAGKGRPKKRKAVKAFEVVTQERPARGKGKKKEVIQLRAELDERERAFRMGPRKKKVRDLKQPELTVPKAIKRKIRIGESIMVGELAKRMGAKSGEVIRKLIDLGVMATVNQILDLDEASLVAGEFGYEVERVMARGEELSAGVEAPEALENLRPRPPVVTVMGHVDHGKTSLLDAIRQTHVTDQEVGGITQHIGAYQVEVKGQWITFLDTPGHEAFTSLRARGAQVTDVVVLVVAADDGVMNQTREAIDHARAAGVPIIVAVNKIDKPNAEPERVRKELTQLGLVSEEWGGDTIFCEVSAKQRVGIEALLENILIQAEVLELKANPEKLARGTVIEAKLDRGRGPVATVLVQEGTLKLNDAFVAGAYAGKVRMMLDHLGRRVEQAGPAIPVEVVGASGVPAAGEKFWAVTDEKEARDIEAFRREKIRKEEMAQTGRVSLDRLKEQVDAGGMKDLFVVLKGDVQGSIQTLRETLGRMGGEKVKIQVIHASVGGITENDVNLASASRAIIIGFNVRPEPRAQTLSEELEVEIRLYNIIYELIEDVEKALLGMLEPTRKENLLGRGEVIQTFKISKVGMVAGTMVKEGRVTRGAKARLIRDGVVVYDGKMATLRRYQDEVKEVLEGQDCGIRLENFNDVKVGDFIEAYEVEEIAPEL